MANQIVAVCNEADFNWGLDFPGEFESRLEEYNEKHGTELCDEDFTFTLDLDEVCRSEDTSEVDYYKLDEYLEILEKMNHSPELEAAIEYLTEELSYSFLDAADKAGDVQLYEGDVEEAARNFVQEMGDLPSDYEDFFDFNAFGESMVNNGDWGEIRVGHHNYTVLNHSNL